MSVRMQVAVQARWYQLTNQSSGTDTGVSHGAGQVIGVAVKNGKTYNINNTWVLSGNPATETTLCIHHCLGGCFVWHAGWKWNATGATCPLPIRWTGYRPVSSASLPTATVLNGRKYFDTSLWLLFNGDAINHISKFSTLVWIKNRGSVKITILTTLFVAQINRFNQAPPLLKLRIQTKSNFF